MKRNPWGGPRKTAGNNLAEAMAAITNRRRQGENNDVSHTFDRRNLHDGHLKDVERTLKMITKQALKASRSFFKGMDETEDPGRIPTEADNRSSRLSQSPSMDQTGFWSGLKGELEHATLHSES